MTDKLMFICNENTQYNFFGWFQLVVEKFGISTLLNIPQVVKPTNKKTLLEKSVKSTAQCPLPTFICSEEYINFNHNMIVV